METSEQLTLFNEQPSEAADVPSGRPPRGDTATAPQGHVPTVRPAALPSGCRWHEVQTPHQTIGFMLRKSRRKTIGLTITDDGLMVTAPQWVPFRQVAHAVQTKAPWILRKLRTLHERQQHLATADAHWRDGGCFPYLGVYVSLQIRPDARSARFSGDPRQPAPGDVLCIPMQADSTPDRIRERVQAWLQQQALILFEARLNHFCALADVQLKAWRLSSPAARWGSCSSDGRIMLNWRLIHFAPSVVDYVVAHEVAHLRHMNHGPAFWKEVESLFPNYGEARRALKPHHPGSLPLL